MGEQVAAGLYGGIAQLGEHLPCKQGVKGSNPFISTKAFLRASDFKCCERKDIESWLSFYKTLYLENYTLIRRHQILIECFKTNSISLTKQKPEPGQRDATCCG